MLTKICIHRKTINREKKIRGFSLVEFLVVIGIIGLLSAIVLPGYQKGARQLAFTRSVHKLAQDLRRAQEMGMSAREFGGTTPEGGYGIYIATSTPTSYILFADSNNNGDYEESEKIEEIEFEKGTSVIDLDPSLGDVLIIVFIPPIPLTLIYPNGLPVPEASITLTNNDQTNIVRVNSAGLIEIID